MKYFSLINLALVAVVAFYLNLAPFTKVEESFNLQAIHDIVNYGVFPAEQLHNYDHQQFPGVVPRTFVGSFLIGSIIGAANFIFKSVTGSSFINDSHSTQLHVQMIARSILGLFNVVGLVSLKSSIETITHRSKSKQGKVWVGFFFVLLTVSQFHINFYSTRTLPNFFALPLVNYALSKILRGDMSGLTWLGLVATVFRLEVGVFATVIALVSSVVFGQSPLHTNVFLLTIGSVAGVVWSVSIDSYFWGRWLWPEFEAFKFNIIEGSSVKWGVEPYGAYLTKYLPSLFRPPHVLVLAVLGFFADPADDGTPMAVTDDNKLIVRHPARNSLRVLTLSSILYLALMSRQPHKEWRFIIYVVPVLTLLAANGLAGLAKKWRSLFAHRLLFFVMLASTLVSFFASIFMGYVSSFNYPGGAAISYLNNYILENKQLVPVFIHLDVPACMSGVTRFTELNLDNVVYDKTEELKDLNMVWNNITHLITTVDMEKHVQDTDLISYNPKHWKKLHQVNSFKKVDFGPLVKVLEHVHYENALPEDLAPNKVPTARDYISVLRSFLESLVSTQPYLNIYERIHEDAIPQLLKSELSHDRNRANHPILGKKHGRGPPRVEDEVVQDALNEQIDSIEGKQTFIR